MRYYLSLEYNDIIEIVLKNANGAIIYKQNYDIIDDGFNDIKIILQLEEMI